MKEHESLRSQFFQFNLFFSGQRVFGRKERHQVIYIDYLFLKAGSAPRRQRTRKTEVEHALIEASKLVVGIHVATLQPHTPIPARIGLQERRQNGRRRWSDEAYAEVEVP